MQNSDKIKFLWDVIKRYDSYIGAANSKVALLLSFCTAMLIGLIFKTKDIVEKINIDLLKYSIFILSFIILIASIKSIYHLLKTVFPDTSSYTAGKSLIFFGDVAGTENQATGYHQNILNLTEDETIKDLSFQTYELAIITSNKFKEIKKAVNTIKYFLLVPSIIFITLVSIF